MYEYLEELFGIEANSDILRNNAHINPRLILIFS